MKILPPIALAPKTGHPIPEANIAKVEALLDDLRSGAATGFVFVALGPDIGSWREGFVRGRTDRYNLIAQLTMAIRQVEDLEVESE